MAKNLESLLQNLDEIIEMEPTVSFVLLCFYLDEKDLGFIKNQLEPDDPDTGAIGRYRRAPVRSMSEFPKFPRFSKDSEVYMGMVSDEYKGVGFEFCHCLVD